MALALAVITGVAGAASAQEITKSFPVERFRLGADRDAILDTEWAGIPAHLGWDLALWLGAADDPLVVHRADDRARVGSLVSYRVGGTLSGAVSLYGRLQLVAELPLVISQQQEAIIGIMSGELSSFGVGDIRLAPKFALRDGATRIAFMAGVTLPTGAASDYRGEDGVGFAPELIASRPLGALRVSGNLGYRLRRRVAVANLVVDDEIFARIGAGYRLADRGGPPVEIDATVAFATAASGPLAKFNQNYLELIGGAAYNISPSLVGFAAAGVGLNEGFGTPDWRALAGVRYTQRDGDRDGDGVLDLVDGCPGAAEDRDGFADTDGCPDPDNDGDGVLDGDDGAPLEPEDRDLFADADGVPDPDNDGDGILDIDDQCPNEAETANEWLDDDGCPDDVPDSDGDGVADNRDQCPNQLEDIDGFTDEDGCPDPDNDGDGVLDRADRCPDLIGVVDNRGCPDLDGDGDGIVDRLDNCPQEAGSAANHGCVARQLVVIKGGAIEILQEVYFATGRDVIQRRSYPLLDNVARVLTNHTEITKVQVEGHTDDRGRDDANMDLSQRRADAVVAYLIARGIDRDRLVARGFGETNPIASNKTTAGRAQNRRVAFRLLDGSLADEDIETPRE